ncbi:MAG: hypothetical protein LBI96_01440 [Odoribacteraceae bacterium]|jgi:hypothetical protein|nr:hypothetical protein [Odoribacteraceae bacterium]
MTGKWKYKESYGLGEASGEMFLEQQGKLLSGKIIFTDKESGGASYMIQETLSGTLEGRKVKLDATEYDVIHAETSLHYELDTWFGLLVDSSTIIGLSMDAQGMEGYFVFEKVPEDK